ncbi:MAG: GNAT family N-acetyltransferase, partial [Pirellulaceae bacterium]
MRLQCFNNFDDLSPHQEAWERLSGGVPFRRMAWLANWWRQYGAGQRLAIQTVWQDDQLVAIVPWYQHESAASGRVLRLLGDGPVCTDYADLLLHPDHAEASIQLLADSLANSHEDWDLLELENIPASGTHLATLAEQLTAINCRTHSTEALNCWRLALPESWDDFEMAQSKSHRKQIRRLLRRVLESDRAKLHIARTPEEVRSAFPTLIDLHMRRRKSLEQPGCFASEAFARFLPEAAIHMAASGHCELLTLDLDGAAIAAEIHFVDGNISFAYQAGIDPERLEEDPGSLMQIAMIQHAMHAGRQAIDFLLGDEQYKPHWRATATPCVTLRVV